VDTRVVGVGELVEHRALALLHHPLGEIARALHAALLRREDDLGAEGAHRLAPLDREVLGHDQDHAVTADRRRHGEGDAGVARGRLDQHVARLDVAAFLGVADHRDRRPILHRAGRVIAFQLCKNKILVIKNLFPWKTLQPDQRRVADEILDSALHRACSSLT
jgi:hypothetical protein